MDLRVGNVWTVVSGETWEVSALRAYLTVDDDHESFLDETGEDSRFLTGLLPRVIDGFQAETTRILDERTYRWDPDIQQLRADLLDAPYIARDYQMAAARKLLHHGCGIAELPTGAGKTIILALMLKHLSARRRGYITILVDRLFLVQQMLDDLRKTGAVPEAELGALMSKPKRRDLNHRVLVATAHSMYAGLKRGDMEIYRRLQATDVAFVDECHHLSSAQMGRVMAACGARERFGLTATMSEEPGVHGWDELTMEALTGPLRVQVPGHVLRNQGWLASTSLVLVPVQGRIQGFQWAKAYNRGIVEHKGRNSLIISILVALWHAQRKSLTFVTRKEHGRRLLRSCHALGMHPLFVTGGGTVMWVGPSGELAEATWSLAEIASYVERKPRAAVIATQVLDEGVDVPTFNAAVMAGGHKKMRRILQRVGRCMRPAGGETLIFDFVDRHHPFLHSHSKRRLGVYRDERFPALPHKEVEQRLGVPFRPSQALPYAEDW